VIGAVILSVWTVRNILSQPASPRAGGVSLVFDILWSGAVYGLVDALLLSVLPVLATWQAFAALGWTTAWPGKILAGTLAVIASLFVTAAYHLGYPEYRRPGLFGPIFGNGVMTAPAVEQPDHRCYQPHGDAHRRRYPWACVCRPAAASLPAITFSLLKIV
jgi:hypothetical protein